MNMLRVPLRSLRQHFSASGMLCYLGQLQRRKYLHLEIAVSKQVSKELLRFFFQPESIVGLSRLLYFTYLQKPFVAVRNPELLNTVLLDMMGITTGSHFSYFRYYCLKHDVAEILGTCFSLSTQYL